MTPALSAERKPQLWKNIPSTWFNFQDIYDEAVRTAPPDAILVECGSFWGQSAIYLAEAAKIANETRGLDLRVYCCDLWDMRPENNPPLFDQMLGGSESKVHAQFHKSLFETFSHYVDETRLSPNPLRILRMESLEAVGAIRGIARATGRPVHFIFLDDDHDYDYVKQEIQWWVPLMSAGGIIAGHDFTEEFDGVRRATREYFGADRVEVQGSSWIVRGWNSHVLSNI